MKDFLRVLVMLVAVFTVFIGLFLLSNLVNTWLLILIGIVASAGIIIYFILYVGRKKDLDSRND
ncbi:MAG TPA: hypothetical protein VIK89_06625 [Cytophagaceae bacterium]